MVYQSARRCRSLLAHFGSLAFVAVGIRCWLVTGPFARLVHLPALVWAAGACHGRPTRAR